MDRGLVLYAHGDSFRAQFFLRFADRWRWYGELLGCWYGVVALGWPSARGASSGSRAVSATPSLTGICMRQWLDPSGVEPLSENPISLR